MDKSLVMFRIKLIHCQCVQQRVLQITAYLFIYLFIYFKDYLLPLIGKRFFLVLPFIMFTKPVAVYKWITLLKWTTAH